MYHTEQNEATVFQTPLLFALYLLRNKDNIKHKKGVEKNIDQRQWMAFILRQIIPLKLGFI